MNNKIEQAAKGYAYETVHTTATDQNGARHIAFRSFIAGAESRQAEIEEWKQKSIDATCLNDEARDVIIPELCEALELCRSRLASIHFALQHHGVVLDFPELSEAAGIAQKAIQKAKGENR